MRERAHFGDQSSLLRTESTTTTKVMRSIICLLFCQLVSFAAAIFQSGYIVTSPSVFRAGVDHVINVRIFNHADSVRVNAKLVDLREDIVVSISDDVTRSGSLTLKIPANIAGKANLEVCGNCHMTTGFRFHNSTSVTIAEKGTSAFIQTDKPVYKPSQTVKVNVFIVDRDLKPVRDNVTAYVVAPNDVRIQQWVGLQPLCCGVVSFSFPLSDQPVLGSWKIFAELQGQSYNTTFEIQKYVLPKFEVGIKVPPYFREECEEISVSAYHVFGEAVQGQLKVNMTVNGVGYSKTRYLDRGPTIDRNLTINGRAHFTVCMSQLLPPDLSPYFMGALSIYAQVTAADGSQFTAYDDTVPVSRQKVDIEYTEDTRAHFKPGIPFKGKIKAHNLDGSGASDVTVELSVAVNRERFYRQQLSSNADGIISFSVPALPGSANVVWLEASVYAVSGELATNNISIYKNLHNWFAPSNCHILAQGPGVPATPGQAVKVLVKSNCPCNFTLYYEILSRGNIVKTGSKRVLPHGSRHKRSPASFGDSPIPLHTAADEVVNDPVCHTSLVIDVTSEMAPMSRMLVYYVREDGEGIADSIQLPVKPKLLNKVKVTSDSPELRPGDDVNIEVTSSADSCVCLAMVDRSVHVMKPGYMIGAEQIFQEIQNYDLNNLPYEQGVDWWRLSRARRSANMWWDISRDAKYAFLESGLVVMTDVIKLDYKMNVQLFPQLLRQSMQQAIRTHEIPRNEARIQRNRVRRRHRTFFPETWVWRCFQTTSGRQNMTLKAPDSITTWQANAVSLNPSSGIGISEAMTMRSFKHFFVDFNLPYSVIRGEQVRIPVTVYNYLDTCVQAEVSVLISSGVSFKKRGTNRMTKRLCILPRTTQTFHSIVEFGYLGNSNISATVSAISGVTSCCPDDTRRRNTIDYDAITRSILVEAEGIPREYTHSVYFCPNERINLTTPSSYTFQFVRLPSNVTGFQFLVKASNNAHLILTSQQSASSGSYEIVLGGSRNTRSWISRDSQHLVTAATNQILSDDEFRPFWITWTDGNIQVGRGRSEDHVTRFMQWREPSDITRERVLYVGFATSDGARGEFRLWRKEETGGSFSEVFQLSLPPNTIPGSARAVASMIGDVMGPTLNNLNNLLRLPFGCGEQNLANFAPNIYVLRYLQATKQITDDVRSEALHYLQTGYQRQLTYKRRDDSYSAFGDRDSSGSMWLTSFVLKSFAQARDFIYIDPAELHDAKEWIVSWQQRNGAFPAVGKIWNKDIQAGVDSDVALTAYVTIALLEAGLEREDEEIAVMKAQEFLESRVHEDTDSYTSALSAYALTLLDSDYAGEALQRLSMKSINGSGMSHWSLSVPGEAIFTFADSMKQTVASAEVEMTSYALLTYTQMRNVTAALPIVKWISQKRNAIGGFSSTQDTCVALQSLSEYAISSYIDGVNLDVTLASTNLDYERQFELTNENSEVMQRAGIPSLPTTMFVEATGDGCALLQIDVTYNIPDPNPSPSFYINIRHQLLSRNNHAAGAGFVINRYHDVTYEIMACVRWLHHGASNMAVLEFNLLSGFVADRESVQQALESNRMNLKRFEVNERTVLFYFDEISSTCRTCVRFNIVQTHQVGNARPQSARVYDYYEPEYEAEFVYQPPPNMMQQLCDNTTDCDVTNPQESAEGCNGGNCADEYGECHCSHECGYNGPPVCGSNGVVYMNRCRMETASCELELNIEQRDDQFCNNAPSVKPVTSPTASESATEDDDLAAYYDNFFGLLNDQPFPDEIVIPDIQPIKQK